MQWLSEPHSHTLLQQDERSILRRQERSARSWSTSFTFALDIYHLWLAESFRVVGDHIQIVEWITIVQIR